jgi:aryl-alcohol dehydrogenase-like predicted oxidoreductase
MQKRKIGNSDLEVPVLCLGTMTWGTQNTQEQAHEQLNYAVDQRGLYFIDTAEMYPVPPDAKYQGRTETYIGSWLKKRGKRDDLIIATKVGAGRFVRTRDTGPIPRYDRKSIRDAVEGSLKRLQTDYIDLYQVHFPERNTNFFGVRGYKHYGEESPTPIAETLEALNELIAEGKIRHIGVSNETPWGVMQYLDAARELGLPEIISIQNQYSLTNRTYEVGLAEMGIKEQIGLLAYSPLGMGVLSGKYLGGAKPKGARFTLYQRNEARYNPTRAQEAVKKYVEVAKKHGLDPSQMALAFVINQEFVSSAIIGATTMDQLKSNIDAAEITLSPEVLADIEQVHNEYPDVTC